jgi:hypothetical protein
MMIYKYKLFGLKQNSLDLDIFFSYKILRKNIEIKCNHFIERTQTNALLWPQDRSMILQRFNNRMDNTPHNTR